MKLCLLLPGHETHWQDLAAQPWQAWRDAVDEHYWQLRQRHEHVVVCGLSMGGALARHTAARRAACGALLATLRVLVNRRRGSAGCSPPRCRPTRGWQRHRKESVLEAAYDRTPLAAVAQLNVLMHGPVQTRPGGHRPGDRVAPRWTTWSAPPRTSWRSARVPGAAVPLPDKRHAGHPGTTTRRGQ
ncbi:hypothetical protein QJS66_05720 [Kocuria rhizophila]|nr:hypothetical protein QJS66_05720 [Kocuria rhizophila]